MRRVALGVLILALVVATVIGVRVVRHHDTSEFRWTALGDSYSSGLGEIAHPVDCQRDVGVSYVGRADALLRADHYRTTLNFAPCGGARIDDVFTPQTTGVPPQIDSVDATTQVVTMTIGGDDVGFGTIVSSCLVAHFAGQLSALLGAGTADVRPCVVDADNPPNAGGEPAGWTGIENELESMMVAVLAKMSPTGDLFVLTYPLPFADPSSWGATSSAGFTADNAHTFNLGAIRMGDAIDRAVRRANASSTRVHLVDWREQKTETDVWARHGLCGSETAWVHGIRTFEPGGLSVSASNSFHPTAAGYTAAADLLSKSIEAVRKEK